MTVSSSSKSAAVRARVGHPVIDIDGHMNQLTPDFLDYLKRVGGSRIVERYQAAQKGQDSSFEGRWYRMSEAERRDAWVYRPVWWFFPAGNTLDRATASIPRLLHQRMDELGIDFTVLYLGIGAPQFRDDELRQVACRAFNLYHAEIFGEYADRITPAAVIPMNTPQEAIAEMEHAVKVLGLKAVLLKTYESRPVASIQRRYPGLPARVGERLDFYGLDSEYDYDPVWAKCVELKVAPTFHDGLHMYGSYGSNSISNYMYNHMGHHADGCEALCKALFMGGVTRRFPTLRFGFLECGVGWACNLYADLVGHWQKRNEKAMLKNLDPAKLDQQLLRRLILKHADKRVTDRLEEFLETFSPEHQPTPHVLDEWAPCKIQKAEQIRDLFAPHFYFGCEADDPMNAWAFNDKVNPFGARLGACLSSDIGHWDVPDMTRVVAEAYELVERELITEQDFRDFMFTNPVALHGGMNPDFFKGTVVEKDVANLLSRGI